MADVQINSVTKSFGDNGVIHSVDLKVEDTEFMDFVGPSGCLPKLKKRLQSKNF